MDISERFSLSMLNVYVRKPIHHPKVIESQLQRLGVNGGESNVIPPQPQSIKVRIF